MGFDAAAAIRAGSGVMFMLAGALALKVPRFTGRGALSTACFALGAGFLMINLVYFAAPGATISAVALLGQVCGYSVFVAALVWFLLFGPWCEGPRERRLLWIGLGVATVVSAATVWAVQGWLPAFRSLYLTAFAGFPFALDLDFDLTFAIVPFVSLFAMLAARQALMLGQARSTAALSMMGLGISFYFSYNAGGMLIPFSDPGGALFLVLATGVALVIPLAWIPVLRMPGGRVAWFVIVGTLAAFLFGQAEPLLLSGRATTGPGLVRTTAALLVGYALLRGGVDGQESRSLVIRKSTIAAGALAVLFIVAQIAQNFFSAEYGLLTGGIVAGAFLFAASPMQRAFERFGDGRADASSKSASGANDDVYRAAMRLAFRDRRLAPSEELDLADLAERLGIGARRATEIRHQIEREKGVA